MDPTAALTLLPSEGPRKLTPEMIPPTLRLSDGTPPVPQITTAHVTSLPVINADLAAYQALEQAKDEFAKVPEAKYTSARNKANPFEFVGRSIFLNRSAIKLANTDAVYNVTQHLGAFANKTTKGSFTFCDIAAGPGGFTQYIQWRRPDAVGYGMTLRETDLDWDRKNLDMTRFQAIYGTDNSGNLYTQWEFFVNTVRKTIVEGVDLVTGDGGFDVEETKDYSRQEFLSSRLLLTQILVGLSTLRSTGSFVCKVFDTVTSISADLLYVCAACFEEVTIFKPVSSRPASTERYIVALRRRPDPYVIPYIELLKHANNSYVDNVYVTRLFADDVKLPEEFIQWLTRANNESIQRQMIATQNILDMLKGKNPVIHRYDLFKCLLLWNLPDNPLPPRTPYKNLRPKD